MRVLCSCRRFHRQSIPPRICQSTKALFQVALRRLIGDSVIYDIPETNEDLCFVLTTIQLSPSPKEFGSAEKSNFEGYLKEIKEFKAAINGIPPPPVDKLVKRFPKICLCFPLHVQKCLRTLLGD